MGLVELQDFSVTPAGGHQKDGAVGLVMANLSELVGWGRKYSLHPLLFGLACCAIEQISAGKCSAPVRDSLT